MHIARGKNHLVLELHAFLLGGCLSSSQDRVCGNAQIRQVTQHVNPIRLRSSFSISVGCARRHAHKLALHARPRLRQLLAALVADRLLERSALALLPVPVRTIQKSALAFEGSLLQSSLIEGKGPQTVGADSAQTDKA